MTRNNEPALRLLRELIALPSVNPAFRPAGDPWAGEQRVAEFLAALAARAGLAVEFQEVNPPASRLPPAAGSPRANLLAWLTPPGKVRQRVLLAPHLDTVGGESVTMFQPRLRGGRLYGRGACDTKGSIATMLTALLRVARSGPRPRETEVVFAGLVDEENGQAGSRALVATGLRADLALVGEPTRLEVVTAHKGDVWLEIETRGKAAHGAQPELGRNAVHAMARVVHLLETEYADGLRERTHALLGHPTINVGTIHGGSQPNIVPDRCRISVDRRTLPGETESDVRREIKELLRRHGFVARLLNLRAGPCPGMETDLRRPLVRSLLALARQRRAVGVHYFCDAAVLARGGTPSVVFGPGDIAQAHTLDEWVSTRQLDRGVRFLERFLRSLP